MRKLRYCLATFLIFFSTGAEARQVYDHAEILTLAESSPQAGIVRKNLEAAEAVHNQARFYWTPKFDWRVDFAPMPKADLHDVDEKIYRDIKGWGVFFKSELEMTIPIFTSMRIWNNTELAKLGIDAEKLRLSEARLQVRYDVDRAYYGLQLAQAGGDVVGEAESILNRIEKEYEKLLEAGSSQVKDSDRYKIDLVRAEIASNANRIAEARSLARNGLSIHTGLDAEELVVAEMDFSMPAERLKNFEEISEFALAHRIDVRLLELAVKAAEKKAHIRWLEWWPNIGVGVGVNYAYSNAVPKFRDKTIYDSDRYNHFSAGAILSMRWKLDPVNQAFKVRETNAQADAMLEKQKFALRAIRADIEKQYRNAETLEKNLRVARDARRSAKRFMTQELLDYEAGIGDVSDLMSAVRSYIAQRTAYLYALHDYRVSLSKLRLSVGAESDDDIVIGSTEDSDGEIE